MIYNSFIQLFSFFVRLTAGRSEKARLLYEGQRNLFSLLEQKIDPSARYIWFHASSLGEFEQGRPIIERIKKEYPQYKVILTFFSPSGYEVRKDYPLADIVSYLPFDTRANVKRFIDLVNPVKAVFIKYEFWPNYLTELRRRKIHTVVISAIFRPEQLFFRWYGGWYRKVLSSFSHFFVQNEESLELLRTIGDYEVTVCGDTRFDRVIEIARQSKTLPSIETFIAPRGNETVPTVVVGSSWQKEEEYIARYVAAHPSLRLIIAPHVIDESHLKEIEERMPCSVVRYTSATDEQLRSADCVLIDCFGILSSIYRYCDFGVVGGGFISSGIHNILEAAVYGKPTLFGPEYPKFLEAVELLAEGGCFTFVTYEEFAQQMDNLLTDDSLLARTGKIAHHYVHSRLGATDQIIDKLCLGLPSGRSEQ